MESTRPSVLFIHGLWLHASSWQPWQEYFERAGYYTLAPGWPNEPPTVEEARRHPEFVAGQTLNQVAAHYAGIIQGLSSPPVVIGHSFGGLVALKLLDHGLTAATVAIDPAPIKGVWQLPLRQLRAAWPVLSRPRNRHRAVSLNRSQFRFDFANRLTEEESNALYERWSIPSPGRPLWQAALANLSPMAETKVDTRQSRAPLLLMAGQYDNTVPASTTRAMHRLYERAGSQNTSFMEWPDRGHALVIDDGWRELADYVLEWLRVDLASVADELADV
jgi:pimeloyl-ACP methyl ester carboxylesterase